MNVKFWSHQFPPLNKENPPSPEPAGFLVQEGLGLCSLADAFRLADPAEQGLHFRIACDRISRLELGELIRVGIRPAMRNAENPRQQVFRGPGLDMDLSLDRFNRHHITVRDAILLGRVRMDLREGLRCGRLQR